MNEEELFTKGNLVFVSKNGCVVGSLYFRAVKDGKVYRGRIRLYHEHGPSISFEKDPEEVWQLVTEAGFDAYKLKRRDKASRENAILAVKGEDIIGDLVPDFDGTIRKAKGRHIYELYTHGSHSSRGVLVPVDSGCITSLSQEQIKLLRSQILLSTNGKGNAEGDDGKYNNDIVNFANGDIIELTNDKNKYPTWIRQRIGEYGC
ncbi:MAG: hypothetical protein LBJ72_11245 [Dysgonamonadaceae bacterium]|jgi:hypothetical protein|nr:hypothetical protein [Dysgonamonadaceae bacterium]